MGFNLLLLVIYPDRADVQVHAAAGPAVNTGDRADAALRFLARGLFVMDGSKRSPAAAYFTSFGAAMAVVF